MKTSSSVNFGQLHGLDHSIWPSEIADNGENCSYPQQRWGISLTVDHSHLHINSAWFPSPACSGLAYFSYPQLTLPCGCSLRKEVTCCDERFSLVTSIQLATVGAHLGPTHAEYQKVPRSAKIKSLDRIPSSPRARRQGWVTDQSPGLASNIFGPWNPNDTQGWPCWRDKKRQKEETSEGHSWNTSDTFANRTEAAVSAARAPYKPAASGSDAGELLLPERSTLM